MMRNVLILYFFCAILSGIAFPQEEIEIDSKIAAINTDKDYLIISSGENEGVEIGDGMIVHRDGVKIAEAQVIEIRPKAAAAEILNTEGEIRVGDSTLIVKKKGNVQAEEIIKTKTEEKKERISVEVKRSKWTPILGSGAEARSAVPVETVASEAETGADVLDASVIQISQGPSALRININKNANDVFSYALICLRENGYSVIASNRATGTILAFKPIELGIVGELWADATARIGHKILVSLEIKDVGGTAELNAYSIKEHTQKGRQIKLPVTNGTRYYDSLKELVIKIKQRSE